MLRGEWRLINMQKKSCELTDTHHFIRMTCNYVRHAHSIVQHV